jgi:hypothetical protein
MAEQGMGSLPLTNLIVSRDFQRRFYFNYHLRQKKQKQKYFLMIMATEEAERTAVYGKKLVPASTAFVYVTVATDSWCVVRDEWQLSRVSRN